MLLLSSKQQVECLLFLTDKMTKEWFNSSISQQRIYLDTLEQKCWSKMSRYDFPSFLKAHPYFRNWCHFHFRMNMTPTSETIERAKHQRLLEKEEKFQYPRKMEVCKMWCWQWCHKRLLAISITQVHTRLPVADMWIGILSPIKESQSKPLLELERYSWADWNSKFLRDIINSLQVPAVIINSQGIVQAFNEPACKWFGYDSTEILGRNISILMTTTDRENHDNHLKKYDPAKKSIVVGSGRLGIWSLHFLVAYNGL